MEEKEMEGNVQTKADALQAILKESRQTLLALKLQQSELPEPARQFLQKEYKNRLDWGLDELDEAILRQRELAASYQGRQSIQSAGKIESVRTEKERLQAAVDDLLDAPRADHMKGYSVPRLSGIRELYGILSADNPQHVSLANSDSISNLLKDSFNKVIVNKWEEMGRAGYRWWERVVQVEHMNTLQPVSGVLLGEVSALSSIQEGAPYGELEISDSGESKSFVKYGGLLPITLEMIDKDETHKLRQMPLKLAIAASRNVSDLVSNVFTLSNGTGPMMMDGHHVFDAGTHFNLGTAALSSESFEGASQAIYQQALVSSDTQKPRLGLDARYLLVPRALKLIAMQILYPIFGRDLNVVSENMQRGELGDVIVVPNWSDAKDWAAVADPLMAPGIIMAERNGLIPEIIVADGEHGHDMVHSDVINLKVRHYLAVFAADYRPLYKANVP